MTFRHFLRSTLLFVAFFLPSLARAREAVDSPRVRVGIGGGIVGAAAEGEVLDLTTTSSALTPNGVFDLGLQANKHFALYGHFMFGTLISTSHAAAHGIVELTPVHWLSIGTGLGYEAYYMGFDFDFCGCKREEVGPQRVNKSFDGPTIPLLLGFNIGDLDAWNRGGRRSVLRITAEGSTGIDFTDSTIGGRGSLSFGGSWM